MSDLKVVQFPLRAPVELDLVQRLKAVAYEFAGRITVAQCIGCFSIAIQEMQEEQR